MADAKTQPDYLLLLPLPLSRAQTQQKAASLKKRMENTSLKEIIEGELGRISNWKKIEDLPIRRLYRNYTLIYTPKEIAERIRLDITETLAAIGVPVSK